VHNELGISGKGAELLWLELQMDLISAKVYDAVNKKLVKRPFQEGWVPSGVGHNHIFRGRK
jgi:hypothetical protein